jgi:hypothetical protein
MTIRLSMITMLSFVLTAWSCGNDRGVQREKNAGTLPFSCKVNGQPITSTQDPGIFNPALGKITVIAESDKYVAGVVIPLDAQAGQVCKSCSGFVQEKIMHDNGPQERKIFELVKKISVHITSRRGNHYEGTFSFTVKLKEESDQQMTVTDGSFVADIEQ